MKVEMPQLMVERIRWSWRKPLRSSVTVRWGDEPAVVLAEGDGYKPTLTLRITPSN